MSLFNAKAFAEWMKDGYAKSSYKNYKDLARDVNSNPATISRLMNASPQTNTNKASQPKPDLVKRLADKFNKDVNDALRLAGYAPITQTEVDELARRLAAGVMASGFNDLEDEQLKEDFLADMQTIAESMLKRKLQEQEKRKKPEQ